MARREIFADTSGLYALIDRNDGLHAAARRALDELLRNGRRLVVTDYIIDETVTLARSRGGRIVADRVLDLVDQSRGLRIEWIGPERFHSTREYFRRHADHAYSFTDCSSFVVMRELRLTQALTSDRNFLEAGMETLLPVT